MVWLCTGFVREASMIEEMKEVEVDMEDEIVSANGISFLGNYFLCIFFIFISDI